MTRIHRRGRVVGLAILTVAAGLMWRLGPLHLPFFAYKYGGSMLWAIAIYWLVCAVVPQLSIANATAATSFFCLSIEFLKLYRSPATDAFRLTLAGKLILGRIFSWEDIVAYVLAIGVAALLDNIFLRPVQLVTE